MEAELRAAYRHCQAETRAKAKNFYWAFVTLPRAKRAAIYAVYALLRRWDDLVDSDLLPEEKLQMLKAQREVIRSICDEETPPPDPLLLAVSEAISRYRIPHRYFEDVLAGIELDLRKRRYRNFEELREYCYGVAGAVGLISLEIFGYHDSKAREHAVDLGIAMQLVNILRDIKEDLERDRIYLPQEELERFGYSEGELRLGLINDNFRELMGFQVARAREYFARGRKLLGYLPYSSRACPAVLAGLYERLLDRIEARGYDVFNGRISLSPWEKLWTALRCSGASLL
ncbi:MAG: phytoene/squalene synthase family protein [Candidatus Bipolaricaulia bacterium]